MEKNDISIRHINKWLPINNRLNLIVNDNKMHDDVIKRMVTHIGSTALVSNKNEN